MQIVHGLDVSDYQETVDWKTVRAGGRSFAIAKATEGTGNVQETFSRNIDGIRSAGMIAGAYHFFRWDKDPIEQANHFLSVYVPRVGDLPPTIDCELDQNDWAPPPSQAISMVSKFIGAVESIMHGQRAMIYAGYSFVSDHFPVGPFLGHPLWVAAYNNSQEVPVPDGWHPKIWQWSRTEPIVGISTDKGTCDGDRFLGTLADLKAFCLK